MVGEISVVGNRAYVKVNKEGTLENLAPMGWFRTLQLYVISQIKPMAIVEVREFVKKHAK